MTARFKTLLCYKVAEKPVGQLGKLRPIVNRPFGFGLCPNSGGYQPPRRISSRPTSKGQAFFNTVLLALALAGTLYGQAQTGKPTEYDVKAAYLSNFGRFVEWPAGAELAPGIQPPGGEPPGNGSAEPFNVCVLGNDPFGPALDRALAGESISRAPLIPRRIARVQDTPGCRIVFIGVSDDKQLRSILAGLANAAILTVGDSPGFTRRGGMIQFVLDGNRVRFEVNLAAAQRARLNLSSELVKLAVAVRREP